jgi:hypothetical protein
MCVKVKEDRQQNGVYNINFISLCLSGPEADVQCATGRGSHSVTPLLTLHKL